MPIRTNRGRAAVYRRLWGWPLRSPRHLITAVIGLLVLAIVVAIVLQKGLHHHQTSAGAAGATSSATATTSALSGNGGSPTGGASAGSSSVPVTQITQPPQTPVSAPAAPAALGVIKAWGQAWVNHPVGMSTQTWLAQLAPYTEPELLGTMGTVDVANIAATQVTGDPVVVHSYTSSVEATLATNGGGLDITVVDTPTGWLVSTYNPVS